MISTFVKLHRARWCWVPKVILLSLFLSLGEPKAGFGQESLTLARGVGPTSELGLRVLSEAYGHLGITIRDKGLPAERSLVESNKGAYDGEVVRVKGIEEHYPNLIPVSVPITLAEGVVFTKKKKFSVGGWASLWPYSIVIRRGLKFAEKGTSGMGVTLVNTYEECFKLVSRDRHEVTVCDRLTGYYFTRKHHYSDLIALEPPITTFHLYHYLHKKNASLIPRITSALAQMQVQGKIMDLRETYIDELLQAKAGD